MIARRSRLRYLGFGLRPTLTHHAVQKTPVSRVTRSKMVNVGINILIQTSFEMTKSSIGSLEITVDWRRVS